MRRTYGIAALATAALTAAGTLAGLPALADDGDVTAGKADGKSQLRNLTQPRYDEAVVREYRVPTRFGTIYGWVERPVVPPGTEVPTILTYSPYAAISSQVPGQDRGNTDEFFVPRGYARAYFHLVGTANSAGCYDYGGVRERVTARRVVEFLAERRWSNGRVGMIGGSYDGTTQWAAAVETPPHLTTIVPQVAISRWYDYAFGQGVRFASGSGTPLLFDVGFNQVPVPTLDPLHPAGRKALVDSIRPCDTVVHQQRGFGPDPAYDGFWRQRDYRVRADDVKASVLLEGSWVDYNVHPINSARMWHRIADQVPALLRMGQQGHGAAGFADSARVRHAWFDRWLLGRRTGVMELPTVESKANTGRRFSSAEWPPAGTTVESRPLLLRSGGRALALAPGDSPQWVDADPQQSESTVLDGAAPSTSSVYVGEQAERAVRVVGTPRLDVRVGTDMESTHLTPVLFDQAPDGSRSVVTRGLLNSRNRTSLRGSNPVAPGVAWRGRVRFQPTDYVLRTGHRLGLAMMSMNSEEALYADETRATNRLLLAGDTVLRLPVSSVRPDHQ